jgi:hypothetical protein
MRWVKKGVEDAKEERETRKCRQAAILQNMETTNLLDMARA